MGRTVAVISLLGPARHPGDRDPGARPGGEHDTRGGEMRKLLARRSVRLRLTALYTVLFLLSGVVLLAITGGVVVASSAVTAHAPPRPNPHSALARAQARIHQLQAELNAHTLQGVSHQLLVGSAVALGVMTVAAAVLGWIVAGRVLRPLRAITAATRRISADCASTTAKEPAATSTRSSCRSSNLPGQSGRTIKPAMVTLAPAPQPITRRQISRYAESAT